MEIDTIAWGYTLPEAIRMDAAGQLYFSDAMGQGGVYRVTTDGKVETLIADRKLVGGLVLHRAGGFVMAGEQLQHWNKGTGRVLLQLEGVFYFCDVHTDQQGAVYVASIRSNIEAIMNPVSGIAPTFEETKAAMIPGECYRINLDGRIEVLYGDVLLGNGIGFSPDYSAMYHVDSYAQGIIVHDMDSSGLLSQRRLIGQASFSRGSPDGMCVDATGNLWVAHVGGGRIVCLSPLGEEITQINLPAKRISTLTFAGPDLDTLYVCSMDNLQQPERQGTIFRIRNSGFCGLPTTLAAI
ncbi:MAG: SMP-30/gluconolactonase/LRE family protein [Pseudomonadales bacterium]|nr:SMP-30/gluconolactonase/LRE family protein [Pseudomonadales bacterium]